MWKKFLCGTLAGIIGFSSVLMVGNNSVKAASSTTKPIVQKEISQSISSPTNTTAAEVQPYGLKGFLIKLAIKTIKVAIDKGGDVLNYILKWLDKDTASYFKNNKNKIVKSLDQLESWIDDASDLTQSVIKTKLNSLLQGAGVPSTYSLAIADALARTITWLVL